ncbi:MAG TPA: SDR family oxidoreductase [Gaiellaceae bacterium]
MIVVTGASGYVGGLVAGELASRGEATRLLGRDPGRLPQLPGAEPVGADYGDPDSLAAALGEGDRVFMVSMHAGPETRVPLHRSFVEAAMRACVGHVVYLSFVNAGPEATFVHARSHGATEQMLRESGLAWTSIRNSMYADELPGWFDPDGVAREPVGDGRMSFSYRPELAKAIAEVLTGEGHEGRIYDVTTPGSADFAELAELASQLTGKPYRYEPAGHDEWDARWREHGRSGWELEAGHTAYEAIAAGELDVVTDDYRRLTGLEPLTIPQLLESMKDELPVR